VTLGVGVQRRRRRHRGAAAIRTVQPARESATFETAPPGRSCDQDVGGSGIAGASVRGWITAMRAGTRTGRFPTMRGHAASRARILIAEDEAAVAQQIINRFTLLGHDVHWARAVREVRGELSSFQPDVLILDATLTPTAELFQAIRLPRSTRAGVVILTAAGDVGGASVRSSSVPRRLMMKPVRNDDLVEIVEDLLTYI